MNTVEEYRLAMEADPNNPQLPYNCALLLRERGDWAEAEPMLHRAIELDPQFNDAHIELAALNADHGRPDEAALILEQIIDRDPDCRQARVALGKVYVQLKRPDDAIRTIGEDAGDLVLQSLLAAAYLRKGDLDLARTIFEQILKADESSVDAKMNLAVIYARIGDTAKAASYMAACIRP